MGDKTTIEWTDATWNPLRGTKGKWSCVKISEGCAHCYAERFNVRQGGPEYKVGADEFRLDEAILTQPLRWKRPRRIFVCSMTDLFEERVPDEWIDRIFDVMMEGPEHTYQILTKRAERMQNYVTRWLSPALLPEILRYVWLGVSVETQEWADERIPWLLKTPAVVRFLSVEPLLGPVSLLNYLDSEWRFRHVPPDSYIQWVIVGGESGGPPERALVERMPTRMKNGYGVNPWEWRAKPETLEWVRSLRDQCVAASVPFFFKQWGGPTPKSGGRLLDGKEWSEWPK